MPGMTEEHIYTDILVLTPETFPLVRTHKNILKPLNLHSPGSPDPILLCTQCCKWGYSCSAFYTPSLRPSFSLPLLQG